MTPRRPQGLAGDTRAPLASTHTATGFPDRSEPQGAVWTARYQNKRIPASGLVAVRITAGYPRFRLRYELAATVRELAPIWTMFGLADDEFTRRYRERLETVGVDRIRTILDGIRQSAGADPVLLCFEDLTKAPCHRRMFADWWTEQTGEPVLELEEEVVAIEP